MKCSRCGRSLTHATHTVSSRSTTLVFGPRCAKLAGFALANGQRHARSDKPDPRQTELDLLPG